MLKREVLYKGLVEIKSIKRNRDKLTESHTVLEIKSIKVLKAILHWLNKRAMDERILEIKVFNSILSVAYAH